MGGLVLCRLTAEGRCPCPGGTRGPPGSPRVSFGAAAILEPSASPSLSPSPAGWIGSAELGPDSRSTLSLVPFLLFCFVLLFFQDKQPQSSIS